MHYDIHKQNEITLKIKNCQANVDDDDEDDNDDIANIICNKVFLIHDIHCFNEKPSLKWWSLFFMEKKWITF